VVERTFSWLGQNRRMSKDYERLPESFEAFVYAAMRVPADYRRTVSATQRACGSGYGLEKC
jgi:transposase